MLGTQYPFGPPPTFWMGFILPKNRSPGFESCPGDSPPFQTVPLLACWLIAFAMASGRTAINLATKANSLACYPKPTMEPWLAPFRPHRNDTSRFQVFSSPFRDTFQRPVTLLYAIGFGKCLGLDDGATQLPHAISSTGTRDTSSTHQNFAYGTITHYGPSFQTIRLLWLGFIRGPTTPHLHRLVACGFGLAFAVFVRH